MRFLQLYRNATPATILLIAVLFTATVAAVAFQQQGPIAASALTAFAGFSVFHIWVTRPSWITATILLSIHLLLNTIISLYYGIIAFPTETGEGDLVTLTLQAIAIFAGLIYLGFSVWFSRGKIGLNLFISLALYNISLIVTLGFLQWDFYTAPLLGVALGLLFLIVRSVPVLARKTSHSATQGLLDSIQPSQESFDRAEKIFEKEGYKTKRHSSLNNSFIAYSIERSSMFIVYLADNFPEPIFLNENKLLLQGQEITELLEETVKKSSTDIKTLKLSKDLVLPVLFTFKAVKPHPFIMISSIIEANRPTKDLGALILLSPDGLSKLPKNSTSWSQKRLKASLENL